MKRIIKKLLPQKLSTGLVNFKNHYLGGYSFKSYSQEGEDMILRRLLEHQEKGFYVDVGAHHPLRFSNTYFFYKLGWSGINLDAMPGSMAPFKRFRPRDINLEIPVSNSGEALTYYVFNEPALNGFSKELSEARAGKDNGYFIQKEIRLQTSKLSEILDKYLPRNTSIDFLSIDAEGLDLEVLTSLNWKEYRPKVVLVEILGNALDEIVNSPTALFLKKQEYVMYAKSMYSVFFVTKEFYASWLLK